MTIAIVHDDRLVFLKGNGVREVGRPGAVDADTIVQLGSLSKPIASTLVAAVVGEERLACDDPVVRFLPEVRIGSPAIAADVTLRDLLSHRSGVPDHAGALPAAIAAGCSWEELSAERLYRPLGMTRTSSRDADLASASNRAVLPGPRISAGRASPPSWEEIGAGCQLT